MMRNERLTMYIFERWKTAELALGTISGVEVDCLWTFKRWDMGVRTRTRYTRDMTWLLDRSRLLESMGCPVGLVMTIFIATSSKIHCLHQLWCRKSKVLPGRVG